VNDIENVISRLEKQRSAIDRALLALQDIAGPNTPKAQPASQSKSRKRRLSPEGRRRIIEATKRRWAGKRAAATAIAPKSAAAASRSRRGALSAGTETAGIGHEKEMGRRQEIGQEPAGLTKGRSGPLGFPRQGSTLIACERRVG
jgi:hypothetical protein